MAACHFFFSNPISNLEGTNPYDLVAKYRPAALPKSLRQTRKTQIQSKALFFIPAADRTKLFFCRHSYKIGDGYNHGITLDDQDSGAVAWLWEHLKWYADYDDVAFIESLLRNLDDDDYYFIRVGESNDDTEIHGGFWDNPLGMCLVRGIAFD